MSDYLDRVRVRIAPSPTGDPHVGTAYIALFNYAFARQQDGDFILRIEDTDRERSSLESEKAIMHALTWLGLEWDEGPDLDAAYGPYRQSERVHIYREYAEKLVEADAVYPCFCTQERLATMREQQMNQGRDLGYDGLCRQLDEVEVQEKIDAGVPYTLRLKSPLQGETSFTDLVRGQVTFRNAEVEDLILLKSDGFPTYHLANVVDDHLMKISHVVRAEEWISSTPKHVLIYQAFGWEQPQFVHMPLLRNKDKSKISKRKNPTSLDWYRREGYLPEAMRNFLALMGWSMGEDQEVFSLQDMIDNFSWDRVKTSGPVFDLQKLEWLNGEYIRALAPEQLLERILEEPYTQHTDKTVAELLPIVKLVQERIKTLVEFDKMTGFFFEREDYDAEDLVPKKKNAAFLQEMLPVLIQKLGGVQTWETDPLEQALRDLCDEHEWKRGAVYMPLRVAITCRKVSTPLFETMEILGREECFGRLHDAVKKAKSLD
jgi:glutamyl-tRNA synthetase